MLLGLTLAATLLFGGCEKDNRQILPGKGGTGVSTQKNTPGFLLSTGSRCGGSICGAEEIGSNSKYNSIILNSGGVSLVYTLYERTFGNASFETYRPFAQFTCGNVTYAGGLVNNGAKILVYATFVGSPAPDPTTPNGDIVVVGGTLSGQLANSAFQTITVGNFKGLSCGGPPNG